MPNTKRNRAGLGHEPFWYKSGVIYEVHVRAFYDSDADGTGDFRGLTEKLLSIRGKRTAQSCSKRPRGVAGA